MDRSKALTWTELRVGGVVIASLLILAGTILYIGGEGSSPFARKYEIKALMADVNGLKPGAPVRVGGVDVGAVTRVGFAPEGGGGMVEVGMRLDRRVQRRVTTQSRATLGAMGLLGEKAVDITSASDGQPIEDGGYVAASAEDPFKGLLADTSESTAHIKRILSRIDAGEGLIGKALRDEELYQRMVDVSTRLQFVTGKLESTSGPLGRLMNDEVLSQRLSHSVEGMDRVVTRVESGQGALGALSKDEDLVRELKGIASSLNGVASRLDRGEGAAGRFLHDDTLYKRLDTVSTRLDAMTQRLEKGEGTAGKLLQDPELYQNLNDALKDARGLLSDIRRDPRKYLRVKLSLF